MEPTVKMGHASAAIERRAYAAQIAACEEPHAVTPRGQMNEAIEEKRGLGAYLERGQIGRAHVCTPVTLAHRVCRLLLDKNINHSNPHTTHQTSRLKPPP